MSKNWDLQNGGATFGGARVLLRRGAKLAEVARRLKVSRTSVWRWEQTLDANGRRPAQGTARAATDRR